MTVNAMPDVHTLTGAYVCDALAPAEREAFEEHLAQCSACRQEVAELREVAAVLGTAVALQPPDRLKAAIDARIDVTRQLPPNALRPNALPPNVGDESGGSSDSGGGGSRSEIGEGGAAAVTVQDTQGRVTPIGDAPSRRRRRALTWSGWAAAAAFAGVAAGLGVHTEGQQRQINALSQRAGVVQQLLSAPDVHSRSAPVRTGGTALVLDSRSRDEAVISFVGLSAPPAGKTYQLWMMGPTGARSGGLLPVPATGNPSPVVAHDLGDAQTIGLTVEPAHGSTQPTTTPVLLLPMG